MKKIMTITTVTMLLLGIFSFNVSAKENVSVYIDGTKIEFDVPPQIINGRTMVPMRKIFEELGATVEWDGSTQTASGKKGDTVVKFTINNYKMYKNKTSKALDVPAQLINGRTLIPLRAVSEAFDCQVGWDGTTSTISIIDDFENYTMLYALGDRSKSFPAFSVPEQLTVGWYTEPVQMLYAVGKSAVFKKSEVPAQLTVGWYEYPVSQVYAVDGRTIIINKSDLSAYLGVGWYEYPVVLVYAADGRSMIINKGELTAYLKVGWYKTLAETQQTMYAPDGRTITVFKAEVSSYEKVGWYKTSSDAQAANKTISDVTTSDSSSFNGNYYKTPTGKKYHLDPNCGGKNSFITTNISGLSPCSKCAN